MAIREDFEKRWHASAQDGASVRLILTDESPHYTIELGTNGSRMQIDRSQARELGLLLQRLGEPQHSTKCGTAYRGCAPECEQSMVHGTWDRIDGAFAWQLGGKTVGTVREDDNKAFFHAEADCVGAIFDDLSEARAWVEWRADR